jgi:hypothetical protein
MKPTLLILTVRRLFSARLMAAAMAAVLWTGCGPSAGSASAGKGPGGAGAKATGSAVNPLAKTNAPVVVVKSVFHLGPQAGRDPFFPNSQRSQANVATEATPIVQLPIQSYLKLVGIWRGAASPMALINKTPLRLGEEGDVSIVISNQVGKAEVQKISVRCLEIRRDSVLVNIAGQPGAKELRLAQRK